jgi:hypothetical protein
MTTDAAFVLDEVQLPGRKVISGKDFLVGKPNWVSSSK